MSPLTKAALVMGALVAPAAVVPQGPPPVSAQAAGTIAYMRDNDATGDEIWLIRSDGSNNRRIWSVGQPDPYGDIYKITDLDWRPDAGEIAFASQHEQACSIYELDIYAIRANGSGYRRVTNGPACAALARYPKGTVTVTVRNFTTRGPFFVYIQGAPEIKAVVAPAGHSTNVLITEVADFGRSVLQQAVVIGGLNRWVAPIALTDVKPRQTTHAGTLHVSGAGIRNFGEQGPSWHSGGSRLGFIISGGAGMGQISANPPAGNTGTPLLKATGVLASVMDWAPPRALANQILYWIYVKDGRIDGGIYRVTEGSDTRGTKLVDTGVDQVIDLQWLPHGAGFLFTRFGNFGSNANVYRYDFVTRAVTQLTRFTDEFAIDVSVSPDSQSIVFERSTTKELSAGDLWVMRRDGTNMRLLAKNGLRPSWSPRALP